jgi:hypothetical protein
VHAPDPVPAEVVRLAAKDEARHVAFGLGQLARHAGRDPGLRARLAGAVERRYETLRYTTGLNEEVYDALLATMHDGRRQRLSRLGFTAGEADALSALHARNFM